MSKQGGERQFFLLKLDKIRSRHELEDQWKAHWPSEKLRVALSGEKKLSLMIRSLNSNPLIHLCKHNFLSQNKTILYRLLNLYIKFNIQEKRTGEYLIYWIIYIHKYNLCVFFFFYKTSIGIENQSGALIIFIHPLLVIWRTWPSYLLFLLSL